MWCAGKGRGSIEPPGRHARQERDRERDLQGDRATGRSEGGASSPSSPVPSSDPQETRSARFASTSRFLRKGRSRFQAPSSFRKRCALQALSRDLREDDSGSTADDMHRRAARTRAHCKVTMSACALTQAALRPSHAAGKDAGACAEQARRTRRRLKFASKTRSVLGEATRVQVGTEARPLPLGSLSSCLPVNLLLETASRPRRKGPDGHRPSVQTPPGSTSSLSRCLPVQSSLATASRRERRRTAERGITCA